MNPLRLHFLEEGGFSFDYEDLEEGAGILCAPQPLQKISLVAGVNFGTKYRPYNRVSFDIPSGQRLNVVGDAPLSLSFKVLVIKGDVPLPFIRERLTYLKVGADFDTVLCFGKNLGLPYMDEWRATWGFNAYSVLELDKVPVGKISSILYNNRKMHLEIFRLADGGLKYNLHRV